MAILLFAAPVAGLRGKVGGNIFSANKSGPYLKTWGKGSNPRSDTQTEHRAALIEFSQSWRDITSAQRTDWDTYAALAAQDKINSLGETYSASGFAWFVQINLARKQAGQTQLDPAPTVAIPGTPIINIVRFDTTASALNSAVNMKAGSPDQSLDHVIRAQVVNSNGIQVFASLRTYMVTAALDGFRNVFFQDAIESHFGTIGLGQKIFIDIVIQNSDGRQGAGATENAESETN